ncbi:transient receptor potential cation channel subfamily A member 1 homolog isoform X1 [Scylla paramamosain]|uniref:transient receptor potential cation channel subfamily A member 1 homolog isoform X1 n=1 Tax=Scylla paramamosain TaxID=85552 RepID=UPI0030834BEF
MADKHDDTTTILRNPRKPVLPQQRHTLQTSNIPLRERKKSERQERDVHVTITMTNAAYTDSLDELDKRLESDPSSKLLRAIARSRFEECEALLNKGMRLSSVRDTDGSTALHTLAKKAVKGDDQALKIALLLIKLGAKLDVNDNKRNTPLHIAAREGLCELCKVIIDQAKETGICILNSLNEKSMTPLHLAVQEGQCEVVELMLSREAKPNMKDDRGWLPVHYAADKGCVKCCKALAPHYQGDKALTKRQEALVMVAAKKGYYKVCKEFPAEKLDIGYKDSNNNTALHIAAKKGCDKFVEYLLELGASPDLPNYCGFTPLMAAVAKDKEKCVAALVRKGASLTMTSIDGSNVLHIAAANKSSKCMAYLLKHKDVKKLINDKDNEDFTPLFLAVQRKSNKCLKLLEDAGASPLTGNEDKASVIYYSESYRGSAVIQVMLFQERNVNLMNENKMTPLHIAAREGFTEVCKSLLRKGARINICDKDGRTPLHWASQYGHDDTVKLLLKRGATRRAKDDKKLTALHWAAFTGKLECCKVLLDADRGLMKETDRRSKYALDFAFQQGRFDVFIFLLKNFSQKTMQIPEDLAERFHEYVHKMLKDKKRVLLDAVIKSNWWEAGFGASEKRFHGEEPCPLFREMIQTFPELASDIMTKCYSRRKNFRLLEDNYFIHVPKSKAQGSFRDSIKESVQDKEGDATASNLNWKLHHPVSTMVSRRRLELLQHPLVKAWVRYKWRAYAWWIFTTLMAIRIFSIAMLVWLLSSLRGSFQQQMKNLDEDQCFNSLAVSWVNMWLLLSAFLLRLFVNVNYWYQMRLKWTSALVVIEGLGWFLTSVVLGGIFYSLLHTCDTMKMVYIVGIIAVVLEGLHFVFVVDQLPFSNILTNITKDFLHKYLKGIACVTCLVILFAFIFHLLFMADDHFRTMAESILSIALWQWGDFNQEVFFNITMFRMFSHILFIIYLFTFGALIVTIIQAPSIERETVQLNKEIGMIDLLFDIDVCFPMLRKVCDGSQLDENSSYMGTNRKERLGSWKIYEGKENEAPGDEAVFSLSSKCQRCRLINIGENENERRAMHDLLIGSMEGLRRDLKHLHSQINVLQSKAFTAKGERVT